MSPCRAAVHRGSVLAALTPLALAACTQRAAAPADPLPSWNEGPTKQAVVSFVRAVTDSTGPQYVPPERRVAAFDNDGTLWIERPLYIQVAFLLDRVRALAPQHPDWRHRQPFRAALDNDPAALGALPPEQFVAMALAVQAGTAQDAFDSLAGVWLAGFRHPRLNAGLAGLVYQPMLELLVYLRANGFTTFIVTGGGIDFVRLVSRDLYGVPPWQVVGSSLAYVYDTSSATIQRLPSLAFVDDRAGKPVGIQQHIGLRPIFVAGNSDGDRQMMEYAGARRPSLQILVHHDDAEREYAYDHGAEVTLAEARSKGFLVVSMRNDWRRVFP